MAEITLDLISKQIDRVREGQTQIQVDMLVLGATLQRVDGTLQGLISEVRAVHTQIARVMERLDKLEKRSRGEEPSREA